MRTLVIHPKDTSTDFLAGIYANKDWTIIEYNCSDAYIRLQMMTHDRIIIMGHGIPSGLLGHGKLFIHSRFVDLLRDPNKKYVFIWCNADMFVDYYNLHAFYSGMFISEVQEAEYFNIEATQEQIDFSNELFAKVVNKSIDTDTLYETVKKEYVGANPIIEYNNQRLYYNGK